MNVKTQSYSLVYKNNDLLSSFVCTRDRNENLFFFCINFIREYLTINGSISSNGSGANDEFGNNDNTLKPLYTAVILWP